MNKFTMYFFILLSIASAVAIGQTENTDERISNGQASYYAKKFQGRKTATGEIFNNSDYTAAHRTLPFGTYVNVINKANKYNVIVRVNDRGPYAKNRLIDLSEAAARRIGGYHHGLVQVSLEVLDIIQLTPELDSIFHASPVVDCLGNKAELSGVSLSLWKTKDLLHAIYVANDLYLKENVKKVLIASKGTPGDLSYHVVITDIPNLKSAMKLKDEYERKGFMRVAVFNFK